MFSCPLPCLYNHSHQWHSLSFYSVSTPLQYIEASKTDESVLGSGSNEVSEMIPVQ